MTLRVVLLLLFLNNTKIMMASLQRKKYEICSVSMTDPIFQAAV